jgi:hypothetical protein
MLNDKVEVSKCGRCFVHVSHVKSVFIQRSNRRAFVHVDILNPKFPTFFQVSIGPGIAQFPSLGISVPFGGVKLYSLPLIGFGVSLQKLQTVLPVARIPKSVCDDAIRMLPSEGLISLEIGKSMMIEVT